jgi:hypothetical protein
MVALRLRKASSRELELSFSAGSREEREVVAALRSGIGMDWT